MTKTARRAIIFRFVFYVVAAVFIFSVVALQRSIGVGIEPVVGSPSPGQQRELDALLEMNHLITTLCTGLLGGLGFLLVNGRKSRRRSVTLWAAFGSAVCVGCSLFFGYVLYLAIISMLQFGFFNLNNPQILWARQAHFYSFLLAVVLFGDFAFHNLSGEDQHARSDRVTDS
jgi:hypothetical protein